MVDNRAGTNKSGKNNKRHGRKMMSAIILIPLTIIIAAFTGLLVFYGIMYAQAKRQTVVLPSYVGKDFAIAKEELTKLGFKVVVAFRNIDRLLTGYDRFTRRGYDPSSSFMAVY